MIRTKASVKALYGVIAGGSRRTDKVFVSMLYPFFITDEPVIPQMDLHDISVLDIGKNTEQADNSDYLLDIYEFNVRGLITEFDAPAEFTEALREIFSFEILGIVKDVEIIAEQVGFGHDVYSFDLLAISVETDVVSEHSLTNFDIYSFEVITP